MTNVLSPVNNSVMSFLTNAQQVVCHYFNCSIEFPSMMWNVSFIHINLPFYTAQYCWWTWIDMTGHPMYKLKSLTTCNNIMYNMYHNCHKLFLLQKRVDITLNFLVSGHFMLKVRIVGISECVVAPWVPSVTCYMLRANCYNAKRWKCYLLCYKVYASKHYTSLRCEDSLTHWQELTSQGNTFLQLSALESIIFNGKVMRLLLQTNVCSF